MKTKFLTIILMLANLFLYAIDYNAKAIITKDSAFVGDVLKLDLVLNAKSLPSEFDIASDDKLSVKKLKPFEILEGTDDTYITTYQIVPIVSGDLEIPSFITKDSDGNNYITQPLSINIQDPESSTEMILATDYSPKKVFVGQAVNIRYMWKTLYPLNSIKSVNITVPNFDDKNFKSYPDAYYINSNDKEAIGLPVHNQRLIGKTHILKFDDTRRAYGVSFETIAIPLKAGIFTIKAPSLVCAVPKDRDVSAGVPQRLASKNFLYPAYFDNEFFNYQTEASTLKKQFVQANDMQIEVLPLPLEGMPEGFSYIIGEYDISAKLPETNVRVGDTLDLKLTIQALNGSSLEKVELNEHNFIGLGFDKFEFSKSLIGEIDDTKKIFNIKLLVQSIESTKIPAIKLSYFNPSDEKYYTITTEEINLVVSPSQSARILAEDGSEILIKTSLTKNKAGIYDTQVDENFFTAKEKSFLGNLSLFEFLLLSLISPAIFLFIVMRKITKKVFLNSKNLRDKIAFSLNINKLNLKSQVSAKEIETIIQDLFSLYIPVEKDAMSFVEIESFLKQRNCPENLIGKLGEIFIKIRDNSYSKSRENALNKDLLKETIKVLKKINRNLK